MWWNVARISKVQYTSQQDPIYCICTVFLGLQHAELACGEMETRADKYSLYSHYSHKSCARKIRDWYAVNLSDRYGTVALNSDSVSNSGMLKGLVSTYIILLR
jgi:hypothetical protein